MNGYVTVGTNDIEKAAKFYDELLAELGAGRFMESDSFIAWSTGPQTAGLCIIKPEDGNVATVGNGVMLAITVDSNDKVDALYNKAISLGATDAGPAGVRSDSFYAGYFRDLDGNKLNVYCIPQ